MLTTVLYFCRRGDNMLSKKMLGQYLKQLRYSKHISLRQVYAQTGITYSHLSMIENGKRNVTPSLLRTLADLYETNYLLLYEKAGYIDEIIQDTLCTNYRIPVFQSLANGKFRDEDIVGYVPIDYDTSHKEDYYAYLISDDNMEPLFSKEDIAIIYKQENFQSGNTCLISVDGLESIQKLIQTDDGIDLISMNPYYPVRHISNTEMKNLSFKILGKVVEARKQKPFK